VALWTAASAAANLEPKPKKFRMYQFDLYYPDVSDHDLMKALNHLENPVAAPLTYWQCKVVTAGL
jgi:hypothetical protein